MKAKRRISDHRIKQAIARTGNINLFPDLRIPKTTAKNWIHRGGGAVVTNDAFDLHREEFEPRCLELAEQIKAQEAKFKLLQFISATLGLSVQYQHFKADVKKMTIEAIEVATIERLVKDPAYSHFSLTSLWIFAWQQAKLAVSSSSWFRIIKSLKLKREERKKYFCNLKSGYRALKPNQSWHIDISVLRFNGLKAYVQAVRDNFSRMILVYKVSLNYGGKETRELIKSAIKKAEEFGYFNVPEVISDQGTENVTSMVKDLDANKIIKHILAQIDFQFSNSMIESFFHQLKNRHRYFKNIHTLPVLTKNIDFYVKEQEIVKVAIQKRIQFHSSLVCRIC